MRVVWIFSALALALRLLQHLPDQLVQQDTDFAVDVAPYFSELPQMLTVNYPDFLTFKSRQMTWIQTGQLERLNSDWEFLKARQLSSSDIVILAKEFGLLIYSLRNNTRSPVIQHYFDASVCLNYSSVEVNGAVASLYSSQHVAIVDLSKPGYPELLVSGEIEEGIIRAFPLDTTSLLILHKKSGISMYTLTQEAGVVLNKSLNTCLDAVTPLILDGIILDSKLYLLEQNKGLVSLSLPNFTDFREYGVSGSRLIANSDSLIVDGSKALHRVNQTISSLQLPFTYTNDLFTRIHDYYFFHNSTHLLVYSLSLNLTTSEYRPDLRDLLSINDTLLLVVTATGASLRTYTTEKTILHGRIPDDSGAIDVRFTATSRDESISVTFTLLIESAPLKVLLLLLLSCGIVLGIIGVAYLIYYSAKAKPKPEVQELTEDSGTALPTYTRSVFT